MLKNYRFTTAVIKKYIKKRLQIKPAGIVLICLIIIYVSRHYLFYEQKQSFLFEDNKDYRYINVTLNNIPKSIRLTTKEAPFSLFKCKCKRLNPLFDVKVDSDEEMEMFLTNKYGEEHVIFTKLNKIEKTDFWRYNVIYQYGGIYMDDDIECLLPFNEWINHLNPYSLPINHHNIDTDIDIDIIIGIAWDKMHQSNNKKIVTHLNPIGFNQYVFAANSKNPMIHHVITNILDGIRSDKMNKSLIKSATNYNDKLNEETLWKTGPDIWTKSIVEYINKYAVEYCDDNENIKEFKNIYPKILFDEEILTQFGQIIKLSYPHNNNKYFWLLILPRNLMDQYAYHHSIGSWKSGFSFKQFINNIYLKTNNLLSYKC